MTESSSELTPEPTSVRIRVTRQIVQLPAGTQAWIRWADDTITGPFPAIAIAEDVQGYSYQCGLVMGQMNEDHVVDLGPPTQIVGDPRVMVLHPSIHRAVENLWLPLEGDGVEVYFIDPSVPPAEHGKGHLRKV